MTRLTALGIDATVEQMLRATATAVPPEDIEFLRGLTSTPLLHKVTPRFDVPGELAVQGHAVRNMFVPAGMDIDAAAAIAMEMTKRSRNLHTHSPGALRATGVVQAESGQLYLMGLHDAMWNPTTVKGAPLELHGGVVEPKGLTDRTIPPGLAQANQYGNGDLYLEHAVDPYFGQPRVTPLEPGVVGIASSTQFVRLAQGRSTAVPGTWPTEAVWKRDYAAKW
jgi:hypothetical protein